MSCMPSGSQLMPASPETPPLRNESGYWCRAEVARSGSLLPEGGEQGRHAPVPKLVEAGAYRGQQRLALQIRERRPWRGTRWA